MSKKRVHFNADKRFDTIIYIIVVIMVLMCLYPLYLVIINSLSDPYAVARGEVYLIPVGFSFDAYKEALKNANIATGYINSIYYTVVGTILSMLLTIPAAYALSKQRMAGRNVLMMMILITMYFSGGLIPSYILVREMGLLNTRAIVLLSAAVSSSNLIVARTFFNAIPHELEEAAEIDGASTLQIFLKIVLPLSKAMLGVIMLYYAVDRWNNFTASLYFQPMKPELYSLQMVLRNILIQIQNSANVENSAAEYYANLLDQIKYSIIVISSLPLLIIYPFLQKYFEKGVMLGSVKG